MGLGSSRPASEGGERRSMSDTEQVMLVEVNIARGCLESFNRMLTSHAIVLSLLVTINFVGFLQPPRGWEGDSGHMFGGSKLLRVFSFANGLSFYTAITGLLFYIYCSHSSIVSLDCVVLPSENVSAHLLRAALRRVALPSMRRRCIILFLFMALSLICCIAAYISAGLASISPIDRTVGVIVPAGAGCFVVAIFLLMSAVKLVLELKFDARFKQLWSIMSPPIQEPEIRALSRATAHALDPLPYGLSCCFQSSFRAENNV